jgi:hypothetical protein
VWNAEAEPSIKCGVKELSHRQLLIPHQGREAFFYTAADPGCWQILADREPSMSE